MRKTHKFLSIILAILIVISIVPFTVSATETENSCEHVTGIIPELAPTETKPGLTAGIVCFSCNAILSEQEIIPSLGTTNDASVIVLGTCGTNATWTYNTETGALIISGTGAMEKYKSAQNRPWEKYEDAIKSIVIEDGITKIDGYAFKSCSSLLYVSIPDSVTIIGAGVFKGCTSLRSIVIPDSVTSIGSYAFENCKKLIDVTIGKKVGTIFNKTFNGCAALTEVYYTGTKEQWSKISIGTNNEPIHNATIHYTGTENAGDTEHKHDYTIVTVDPTCTENGYTSYTCECGYKYEKIYDALGHSKVEIPLLLPTTESVGYTRGEKCITCEMIFAEPVEVPIIDESVIAGDAGGQVIWTYNDETKTMEFFGNGEIYDYYVDYSSSFYEDERPWPTYYDIKYIVVHEGITYIGDCAFCDFAKLKKITLPSTLKTVGYDAFLGCGRFSVSYAGTQEDWNKVIIYNSGNSDLYNAKFYFSDFNGVTASGTHGDNLVWIYNGETFTLTISGTGPMKYGSYPWEEYKVDIENVVIEDGVTTIAEGAFDNFRFNNLTLPTSVTTIEKRAFAYCNYLENIYYMGTEEQWNNIFIDMTESVFWGSNYPLTYATIYFIGSGNSDDPEHTHKYEESPIEPTCTKYGYSVYTCECGNAYARGYVEALGHNYTSKITTPATHLATGIETFTCTCGDAYTEIIEKIAEHNHEAVITAPTCTEQGYTTYTCECGDTYVDNYVDATRHNYETVVTPPTCTEQGYTTYTCEFGDSYVDDYVDATGHSYGDWVVTKEATVGAEGEMERLCSCGEKEYKVIEKLPAVDNEDEDVENPDIPNTSSNTSSFAYSVFMLITFACATASLLFVRRRRCK